MGRSQPGAERQAAELRAAGYPVVTAPLIRIEALPPILPAQPFEAVVFLSEHAVRHGLAALQSCSWFAAARLLAVGGRTASVLEAAGHRSTAPARASSEGLLAAPELTKAASVLLVCGVGGRDLLEQTLCERGVRVARCVCYRRVAVDALDPAAAACDVAIAASAEALRVLAELWLGAGGRSDLPILVPSARVAGIGVELGFGRLHDCGGADSDAWLRGLAALQSTETQ